MVRSYESIQIFKLLLVAIIGIVKVYSCTYEYSGVGFLTYGKNVMKILQCKTVQFVNILTVQVFLLTENRVESVKKYATYLNLQSNSAISNYSLSRTNFLVPRKNYSDYLQFSRKCSSQKPIHGHFFLCVRTRVYNRMLFQLIF